ncbi:aminoglycoside phosphotransferase family protein [Flavobacteriaceae bacterium S0825]|uniref:phosphotransferase enzyme family protein n=1 Tax=Gaetbulibacter sp. S0825 TaxID=2720084 RepID=UPI00142FA53C|nr:aminoglycoside phosphotransferase family protein [Gaetbulibacter sp. S0825]MCK0108945.1 aminoglycoside phosphotransferase family protein [Flavobacteriaceae bacterium S0825]NIX64580.1 aminoglycoside phosphotransferase family protein [Gaetbulibacter sp. S0825]
MNLDTLNHVINQFSIDIFNVTFKIINQGYINDTFLVKENTKPKYILQCINTNVFKNVIGLHKNMENALKKLKAFDYTELSLLKTKTGESYFEYNNSFWRLMTFIPQSKAYNFTSNKKIAFEAGRIIGRFHQLLKNENINNYEVTLPNLNYLPYRITEFQEALKSTSAILKSNASLEVTFAKEHLNDFESFYNSNLIERICHNDTKLNNLLFSEDNIGLCLIDLDTIMKGYFHYDFGDAVRTIVSETNEDEKELSKIRFNIALFEAFIDGICSNGPFLNKKEIENLPISCALMPFMHGLRALTDYINGNIYYKVSYPEQNLDRCKSLFQFARLALDKQTEIKTITDNKL